jgi:hypothetical protein
MIKIIDLIIIICIFVLIKIYFFRNDEKMNDSVKPTINENIKKKIKKVSFDDNIINYKFDNEKQCRRYYDERITKPLVPEFEEITMSANPTIQEVYDRHVVDYRKMIPDKQKLDNDNEIISLGAYGNANYTIDQIQYVNEHSMNGGLIDENLYGFDPEFNQNYSIF